MQTTQALVLRTSGTNCELETARALERGGARVDVLSHRRLDIGGRLSPRICEVEGRFKNKKTKMERRRKSAFRPHQAGTRTITTRMFFRDTIVCQQAPQR